MPRRSILITAMMLMLPAIPVFGQLAIPEDEPSRPEPATTVSEPISNPEEMISFGVFSEPIELTTLIDFVGGALNINIVVKGSPTGEIVFNAPVEVPAGKLIDLLDAMLDQYGYTITYEPASGFYVVQPTSEVKPVFGDELATTRIIPTPNIKPSLLVSPLMATLSGSGQSGTNSGGSNAIQAVDELGVLIINAPSRDIRRIEQMVEVLISIDKEQRFIRFELDHLAAPIALDRVVGLAGGSSQSGGAINVQNQNNRNNPGGNQGGAVVSLSGGSLTNLGERITIDPQGNALIFKGTENEIDRVRQLLDVIDVPNTLEPRNYFAGSSAAQIADIAKRRGLGEVIQIESDQSQVNPFFGFNQNNQTNIQSNDQGQGGPVMVVDPSRGNIIYYGTSDQQAQLGALLEELKTEDERVVIRKYPLNHTDALTITDLLNGIITGEAQTGDSVLLPGGSGRNQSRTFINGFPVDGNGEPTGEFDPDKIAVIADEFSNQVLIKAPIKQQEQLGSLITDLDQPRSQVYIQAMIVSVADNEDFTLAFESQITAGEFSFGTNFGLSDRTDFLDPKSVSSGLGGITASVIRSEYVPIIVNATQTNTDVRILSTPQLLVNDNEESEIVSIEEQPYSEISQGNGGNVTGFAGTVEAGTTLRVTPSISKAGFIRMEYYVELSNFVGQGSEGLPPPTNRRTVDGSATIPSNATIVLGGITVEDIRDTIVKVPLLGEIPLVGELFKRTNKVNNKSKLYVFLTPRIMTDPNFSDLKLFSKGPQSEMEIDEDLPALEPEVIDAPGGAGTSELPRITDPIDGPAGAVGETGSGAPTLEPEFIEIGDASEKGSD